jgi:site-specific DNA-methyltransferase (adenine-specific)
MLELNKIYLGDCFKHMTNLDTESIDLILTDPPYNTTESSWDKNIDFNRLFTEYRRVLKPTGSIVMTVVFPFAAKLIIDNIDIFKYDVVWIKSKTTNFANAKNKPMRKHENILIFSKGTTANGSHRKMTYNPQGLVKIDKKITNNRTKKSNIGIRDNYIGNKYIQEYTNYPNTLLDFKSVSNTIHPTEKPIELFEYIINTFSNEGEIILDTFSGSGTTAIAAINTNRRFIAIEQEEYFYESSINRLQKVLSEAKASSPVGLLPDPII